MKKRRKMLMIALLLVSLFLPSSVFSGERSKSLIPSGVGAFPVSPMHASVWFVQKDKVDEKSLILIVYLEGDPGWHSKSTNFHFDWESIPTRIGLSVGDLPVSIKYWQGSLKIEVQGRFFNLQQSNVFLVSDIDKESPSVEGVAYMTSHFVPRPIQL